MSDRCYYTTFQVANMFGVSVATVVNWVNSGKLKAHRTPGGHRRISRNNLLAFSRAHGRPVPKSLLQDERIRVLIVDDERDFGELVRDYLQLKGGMDVEIADSGFQAGFSVGTFKPHVILMDIMMPGMDGFEVYRMLRDDDETRHIPVIACTAYGDPELLIRIEESGFDGCVQKSVSMRDLLNVIASRF